MPSIEQSRAFVRNGLGSATADVDHDAVLNSLQAEIDKHNALKNDLKGRMRKRKPHTEEAQHDASSRGSGAFRFKDGDELPRKSRRKKHARSAEHYASTRHQQQRCSCFHHHSHDEVLKDESAHPFPREPQDPLYDPSQDTDRAFRDSLFDALADDEGAMYWQGVYGEPIHVYHRPSIENEKGELEGMSDEQYAEYVKAKMWEKKNPEIVLERKKRERERMEEEQAKAKRKEEFLRRKERAAWEREHGYGSRREQGEYEYAEPQFEHDKDRPTSEAIAAAWAAYLLGWQQLSADRKASSIPERTQGDVGSRLPWPVMPGQPVKKDFIAAFLRHIPLIEGISRLQLLKAERVRWHPDKVQQRLGSTRLDEATLKKVTGVFRVIDGLVDAERQKKE